jgi:hypothetical protein
MLAGTFTADPEVRMRRTTLVVLLLTAIPAVAQAQLGIAVGIAQPSGDFADVVDSGVHVQGSFNLGLPLLPDFRLDAMWQRYDQVGSGSARLLGASGNVILDLPLIAIKPYLLGGAGYYDLSFDDDGADAGSSSPGFTAGAGLRLGLGRLGVYGEARVLRLTGDNDVTTVPIMVGITF